MRRRALLRISSGGTARAPAPGPARQREAAMRKAAIGLAGITLALTLTPAQAEPAGCVALALVDPVTRGSCRYVATGPGRYTAVTANQWRIEVSKDGGTTWQFMAGAAFPAIPEEGTLATVAGDLVNVAIAWPTACQPHPLPPGCHKLAREGVVSAGDA